MASTPTTVCVHLSDSFDLNTKTLQALTLLPRMATARMPAMESTAPRRSVKLNQSPKPAPMATVNTPATAPTHLQRMATESTLPTANTVLRSAMPSQRLARMVTASTPTMAATLLLRMGMESTPAMENTVQRIRGRLSLRLLLRRTLMGTESTPTMDRTPRRRMATARMLAMASMVLSERRSLRLKLGSRAGVE